MKENCKQLSITIAFLYMSLDWHLTNTSEKNTEHYRKFAISRSMGAAIFSSLLIGIILFLQVLQSNTQ